MDKKVYMPTIEELYKMQSLGVNLYEYLYVKAMESLIISKLNFSYDCGELNFAYKRFNRDANAICAIQKIFPELELESFDSLNNLNFDVLGMSLEKTINFSNTTRMSSDKEIVDDTWKKLQQFPRYRFIYPEDEGLDDIFYRRIKLEKNITDVMLMKKLVEIEPAYMLTEEFTRFFSPFLLNYAIKVYASRYGLSPSLGHEYLGKDILDKKPSSVKRLFRCIEENKL